jgi:hypothetical protein
MFFLVLTIQEAFPCKEYGGEGDYQDVEMDPANALEVRETISSKGLQVVSAANV